MWNAVCRVEKQTYICHLHLGQKLNALPRNYNLFWISCFSTNIVGTILWSESTCLKQTSKWEISVSEFVPPPHIRMLFLSGKILKEFFFFLWCARYMLRFSNRCYSTRCTLILPYLSSIVCNVLTIKKPACNKAGGILVYSSGGWGISQQDLKTASLFCNGLWSG